MNHQQTRALWQAVDWSLQNTQIAQMLGRTPCNATYWRRKLSHPKSPSHKHKLAPSKIHTYADLDWTQNNTALARAAGLSRERIRQIRNALGHPPFSQQRVWAARRLTN